MDDAGDNDDINMIVAIPSGQRLTYEQQVDQLTEPRLKKAKFVLGEETMGDGNCFLWALLDQMR